MTTRCVTLPQSFFAKAKREYQDWKLAFFREVLQNSVDAGATVVNFNFEQHSETDSIIIATDNGCGMDEDTLCNVFLSMGGTKKFDGSVGGFGYAKNIILFAHSSYSIHTGTNLVRGVGGTYELGKVEAFPGTKIEVKMEGTLASHMQRLCEGYVHQMFVQAMVKQGLTVYINGVEVEQDQIEYDVEINTQLGKLWFSEIKNGNDETSTITIAVQGLPMFKHYQVFNGFVCKGILSLEGDTLEMLTANRDSLRNPGALRSELQKVFSNRTARRGIHAVKWFYNLTVPFQWRTSTTVCGDRFAEGTESISTIEDGAPSTVTPAMLNDGYEENFCIRIHNLSNKRMEGVVTAAQARTFLAKKSIQKLAQLWKTCVYSILSAAPDAISSVNIGVLALRSDGSAMSDEDWHIPQTVEFYYQNRRIYVGFIFEPGVVGMCCSNSSGYEILVNPNYFQSMDSIEDLLDVAFHECAHLAQPNHSSEFCNVSDELRRAWRRSYKPKDLKNHWKDMIFYAPDSL